MLKGFFGLVALALIVLTIIIMVVVSFVYRKIKQMREAMQRYNRDDEYFKRVSTKHYREGSRKSPFDADYFRRKEANTTRQRTERQKPRQQTTTAEGVTIVDHRHESEVKKKIFTEDEGEYVEFTEA